jgi:iron complex outermembrane receptor protein
VTNAQPQAQQQAEEQQPPASQPLPGSITIDDAFVPVTVATDRELLASEGSTITDTLMTKPGITGSTFAAGANRPIIRGLDNYRIRTQEDGIGTHDVSNLSEDHAVPVDPFAAERVEVVRGPATLRYGSSAIGGVVSIENNRIPSFVPPRGVMAEIKGGLSSADDGRDAAFSVTTGGASGVVVHADGFKRRSDDYDTPQGRQINSFVDNDGFSIGASYVWRSGFVGIAYARFNSIDGIPGAEALDARPRIDMKQDKVMSKGEWRVHDFGIDAIRFWFGSTNYAHNEIDFNQATSTDEIGSRFTNREQEGRLEVQHLPVGTMLGNLTGTAGAQWGHRNTTGLSFEGDSLLEPATTYVTAGYLFEELEVTKGVRLQAAARVEQDEVRGVGVDDPFGAAAIGGWGSHLHASKRRLRRLVRAAARRSRAPHRPICRARARRPRAVLQRRARCHQYVRNRRPRT